MRNNRLPRSASETRNPSLFLRGPDDPATPRPNEEPQSPAAYDPPAHDDLTLIELVLAQLQADAMFNRICETIRAQSEEKNPAPAA